MYRSFFHRINNTRPFNRVDKSFASTLQRKESSFGNYVNVIRKSLNTVGILGPTAEQVIKDVDLSDKTCLITGANSGIGLEMTRCLSNKDCTVLMACRNIYAADFMARSVCKNTDRLKLYEINLASLTSVKNCSNKIISDGKKLDFVILNAGVFGLPWTLTVDSLETTFQVNYLSHYYLLMNIEKRLAPNARVVFVASESHRYVNWPFTHQLTPTKEMLSLPEHEYAAIRAYNISKLCMILFMHYLGYRWLNSGKSVFSVHPGSFVKTKLSRNWWPYEALYTIMKPFAKTISQAAGTPIYCATSPELNGLSDQYYKNIQRCDESDLAKELHLAFKIYDLTQEILLEHVLATEDTPVEKKAEEYADQSKDAVDDNTIAANYSG